MKIIFKDIKEGSYRAEFSHIQQYMGQFQPIASYCLYPVKFLGENSI